MRQLFRILDSQRLLALSIVTLGFLAALLEGVGIGLFIPFLQGIQAIDATSAADGSRLGRILGRIFDGVPTENRLQVVAAAIFLTVLLKVSVSFVNAHLTARISGKTAHLLRMGILRSVLTAETPALGRFGRARVLNILANESWRSADAGTLLLQVVVSAIALVIYLILLLLISWQLTLLALVCLLVIAGISQLVTRGVRKIGREVSAVNAQLAGRMNDAVVGADIVRAFGRQAEQTSTFAENSAWLARLTTRLGTLSGSIYPTYEILAAALLVGILLISGSRGMPLAPLLVFVFLLYRLVPLVKRLEQARLELAAHSGAIEEVSAILELDDAAIDSSAGVPFQELCEPIYLDKLGFTYPGTSDYALDEVSARIPSRGLVAIVGPSGAGKSTLARLLLRLLVPTRGGIRVNGVPLNEVSVAAWRERVAWVPQHAFLFAATVSENIAFARPQVARSEIEAAAVEAGAHEFIVALPDGYDSMIGKDGVELSGGEAQRICLARALLCKPALLVLDEATNSLDSISERRIQQAIEKLRQQCAIVVVAHRMVTVEGADQILVLDDGRLVESGTVASLRSAGGLFSRLYELQRF